MRTHAIRFSLWTIGIYLTAFVISRVVRHGMPNRNREAWLAVFADQSLGQFVGHLAIKLALNLWHGAFIGFALLTFGIQVPKLIALGLTQLIQLARNLPISIFGVGIDQVTFPALFGPWDPQRGEGVLAFSIAYTFAIIVGRGLIGLLFLKKAMAIRERHRMR